jgi:hypothetical protein
MDRRRSLSWAGKYFLVTSALALVGIVLVVLGIYVAYTQGAGNLYGLGIPAPTSGSALGLIPILLGLVVWRGGKAWAMYMTLTGAMEEELADTFNTEHVKSDIVSVLDDRLADMQQDLQSVNREIRNLKESEEFDFPGNE